MASKTKKSQTALFSLLLGFGLCDLDLDAREGLLQVLDVVLCLVELYGYGLGLNIYLHILDALLVRNRVEHLLCAVWAVDVGSEYHGRNLLLGLLCNSVMRSYIGVGVYKLN